MSPVKKERSTDRSPVSRAGPASLASSPHAPTLVSELGKRRFLFVTGKGGVGKTTFSAALATALASQGKRVLVALPNTKERLSAMLGTKPIPDTLVAVADNIWAVNLSPELALAEYGHLVLKVRAIASAVFDNKYTKTFFRAVPGLYEWAMLGKVWYHTTEVLADGSPRFDLVMLDAPATGHGLDMLRVPKVILDVVPPGVLRRDAESAWALFRDRSRSGVVVVTLPEEMPATETIELTSTIQNELSLPVLWLVINGVLQPLFSPEERGALTRDPSLLDIRAPSRSRGTPDSALVAGARRAAREQVQAESLARLRSALPLPTTELPFLVDDASAIKRTQLLASLLLRA